MVSVGVTTRTNPKAPVAVRRVRNCIRNRTADRTSDGTATRARARTRDRTSTATRSEAPGIFDRRQHRDSNRISTAPRPPHPREPLNTARLPPSRAFLAHATASKLASYLRTRITGTSQTGWRDLVSRRRSQGGAHTDPTGPPRVAGWVAKSRVGLKGAGVSIHPGRRKQSESEVLASSRATPVSADDTGLNESAERSDALS